MKCALVLAVAAALLLMTVNAHPNFNVVEEKPLQNQTLIDIGKCANCVIENLEACLSCKEPCVDNPGLVRCGECIWKNCAVCISACT